jgi:hypothetical protein
VHALVPTLEPVPGQTGGKPASRPRRMHVIHDACSASGRDPTHPAAPVAGTAGVAPGPAAGGVPGAKPG